MTLTPQHFNDSKLRHFLSCTQFLWSNNPQIIPFLLTHPVSSLRWGDVSFAHFSAVPTTPTGKELHRLLFVAQKPPPFFVLNLDFTSFTCWSSIPAAEEISKSILIHPAHADHYPTDCYHFLSAVPSPGWAPAHSPDPCPAAIPYLSLFSLPQFEAFPSLLYLLGRMTRKKHRELKMWDNNWFIQYHNYALVCLLFPSWYFLIFQLLFDPHGTDTSVAILHSSVPRVSPAFYMWNYMHRSTFIYSESQQIYCHWIISADLLPKPYFPEWLCINKTLFISFPKLFMTTQNNPDLCGNTVNFSTYTL